MIVPVCRRGRRYWRSDGGEWSSGGGAGGSGGGSGRLVYTVVLAVSGLQKLHGADVLAKLSTQQLVLPA